MYKHVLFNFFFFSINDEMYMKIMKEIDVLPQLIESNLFPCTTLFALPMLHK